MGHDAEHLALTAALLHANRRIRELETDLAALKSNRVVIFDPADWPRFRSWAACCYVGSSIVHDGVLFVVPRPAPGAGDKAHVPVDQGAGE